MLRAICGGATVLLVCCVTACGPLLGSVFSEPVPASQKLPQSLFTLVDDGDMPDGVNFRPDHTEVLEERQAQALTDSWIEQKGDPDPCLSVWRVTSMSAPNVGSSDDLIVGIGYFEYTYETEGGVWAAAREFQDAAAARSFSDSIFSAADACPDGYSAENDDGSWWGFDSVTAYDVTSALSLPAGVGAVTLREGDSYWGPSTLSTFIRYDRVVVRLSCEVRDESPFEVSDCDRLIEVVARRLVALRF
jgi:hypothetical protein